MHRQIKVIIQQYSIVSPTVKGSDFTYELIARYFNAQLA